MQIFGLTFINLWSHIHILHTWALYWEKVVIRHRFETLDRRQETRDERQKARDKRQETRDKRQKTRDKKQETRDERQETRGRDLTQDTQRQKEILDRRHKIRDSLMKGHLIQSEYKVI